MMDSLACLSSQVASKHQLPCPPLAEPQMLEIVLAASVDYLQQLVNDPAHGQEWLRFINQKDDAGNSPVLVAKLEAHGVTDHDLWVIDLDDLYWQLSTHGIVGQNIPYYNPTAYHQAITQLPIDWLISPDGLITMSRVDFSVAEDSHPQLTNGHYVEGIEGLLVAVMERDDYLLYLFTCSWMFIDEPQQLTRELIVNSLPAAREQFANMLLERYGQLGIRLAANANNEQLVTYLLQTDRGRELLGQPPFRQRMISQAISVDNPRLFAQCNPSDDDLLLACSSGAYQIAISVMGDGIDEERRHTLFRSMASVDSLIYGQDPQLLIATCQGATPIGQIPTAWVDEAIAARPETEELYPYSSHSIPVLELALRHGHYHYLSSKAVQCLNSRWCAPPYTELGLISQLLFTGRMIEHVVDSDEGEAPYFVIELRDHYSGHNLIGVIEPGQPTRGCMLPVTIYYHPGVLLLDLYLLLAGKWVDQRQHAFCSLLQGKLPTAELGEKPEWLIKQIVIAGNWQLLHSLSLGAERVRELLAWYCVIPGPLFSLLLANIRLPAEEELGVFIRAFAAPQISGGSFRALLGFVEYSQPLYVIMAGLCCSKYESQQVAKWRARAIASVKE